jgi:hypothetical protein
MLVSPGPAVTRVKERLFPDTSLKYSAAMPAATSWPKLTQLNLCLALSSKCMMLPPATKKQCV